MKYSFLITIIFLVALISAPVCAVTKAQFPDSQRLQPIPTGVVPNVSENINHKQSSALPGESSSSTVALQNPSVAPAPAGFLPWGVASYLWWLLGGLVLLIAWLWWRHQYKIPS